MALIIIDGFDQYDDDNEMKRAGWFGDGWAQIAPGHTAEVHGPTGKALLFTSVENAQLNFPDSSATFVAGIARIHRQDGPSANGLIFRFIEGGAVQGTLRTQNNGEIDYQRGSSTILGESTGANLIQNTWQYIEVKVLLHASAGTVDIKVDGFNVLSLTSQNTLATSTAVISGVQLWGDNLADPAVDDFYLLDDSGSDNTDFLGECFVETIVPDADGNANDWTRFGGGSNNFEAVDDFSPPDDDTTYNHSATATDQELYGFAALTGSIGVIFGVDASACVRKEDAGFREIQLRSRSNVTEVDSPSKVFGVGYRYINHIYENDPDGGTDWDEAAVNAAQFGVVLET